MMEDIHFDKLRNQMVEEQIISRGICDKRVLSAFLKVPRHKFVPKEFVDKSYADHPIPIGNGQTISQPYIVALMTESLLLTGTEKVLEIGTGSGYQTAILAELSKEVFSIERIPSLADSAGRFFKKLGYNNIKIKVGDGTLGWEEYSPYDRIIVTAGAPEIPQSLLCQLGDNGKMIIPIGGNFSQALTLVEKLKGKIKTSNICGCIFVPLVGEYGWKNPC